jgi:hypothetical protein
MVSSTYRGHASANPVPRRDAVVTPEQEKRWLQSIFVSLVFLSLLTIGAAALLIKAVEYAGDLLSG